MAEPPQLPVNVPDNGHITKENAWVVVAASLSLLGQDLGYKPGTELTKSQLIGPGGRHCHRDQPVYPFWGTMCSNITNEMQYAQGNKPFIKKNSSDYYGPVPLAEKLIAARTKKKYLPSVVHYLIETVASKMFSMQNSKMRKYLEEVQQVDAFDRTHRYYTDNEPSPWRRDTSPKKYRYTVKLLRDALPLVVPPMGPQLGGIATLGDGSSTGIEKQGNRKSTTGSGTEQLGQMAVDANSYAFSDTEEGDTKKSKKAPPAAKKTTTTGSGNKQLGRMTKLLKGTDKKTEVVLSSEENSDESSEEFSSSEDSDEEVTANVKKRKVAAIAGSDDSLGEEGHADENEATSATSTTTATGKATGKAAARTEATGDKEEVADDGDGDVASSETSNGDVQGDVQGAAAVWGEWDKAHRDEWDKAGTLNLTTERILSDEEIEKCMQKGCTGRLQMIFLGLLRSSDQSNMAHGLNLAECNQRLPDVKKMAIIAKRLAMAYFKTKSDVTSQEFVSSFVMGLDPDGILATTTLKGKGELVRFTTPEALYPGGTGHSGEPFQGREKWVIVDLPGPIFVSFCLDVGGKHAQAKKHYEEAKKMNCANEPLEKKHLQQMIKLTEMAGVDFSSIEGFEMQLSDAEQSELKQSLSRLAESTSLGPEDSHEDSSAPPILTRFQEALLARTIQRARTYAFTTFTCRVCDVYAITPGVTEPDPEGNECRAKPMMLSPAGNKRVELLRRYGLKICAPLAGTKDLVDMACRDDRAMERTEHIDLLGLDHPLPKNAAAYQKVTVQLFPKVPIEFLKHMSERSTGNAIVEQGVGVGEEIKALVEMIVKPDVHLYATTDNFIKLRSKNVAYKDSPAILLDLMHAVVLESVVERVKRHAKPDIDSALWNIFAQRYKKLSPTVLRKVKTVQGYVNEFVRVMMCLRFGPPDESEEDAIPVVVDAAPAADADATTKKKKKKGIQKMKGYSTVMNYGAYVKKGITTEVPANSSYNGVLPELGMLPDMLFDIMLVGPTRLNTLMHVSAQERTTPLTLFLIWQVASDLSMVVDELELVQPQMDAVNMKYYLFTTAKSKLKLLSRAALAYQFLHILDRFDCDDDVPSTSQQIKSFWARLYKLVKDGRLTIPPGTTIEDREVEAQVMSEWGGVSNDGNYCVEVDQESILQNTFFMWFLLSYVHYIIQRGRQLKHHMFVFEQFLKENNGKPLGAHGEIILDNDTGFDHHNPYFCAFLPKDLQPEKMFDSIRGESGQPFVMPDADFIKRQVLSIRHVNAPPPEPAPEQRKRKTSVIAIKKAVLKTAASTTTSLQIDLNKAIKEKDVKKIYPILRHCLASVNQFETQQQELKNAEEEQKTQKKRKKK